jgi:uncharacterized membrane protein YecN with MAPEG domain
MEVLRWKTRIAVLWIFMAMAMSAHSIFSFMVPEVVEEMWAMEMGQGMMLLMSLFWWIPMVMAVLSLTLKDKANRWANFVLGIVFTILNIVHLTEHFASPSACQMLIVGSTIVVTGLIAWLAWKWPKQQA